MIAIDTDSPGQGPLAAIACDGGVGAGPMLRTFVQELAGLGTDICGIVPLFADGPQGAPGASANNWLEFTGGVGTLLDHRLWVLRDWWCDLSKGPYSRYSATLG